ncbi:MAG: S24/S26 family peptidase [Phocaeicola sp.]|uniref:S24/S26 family peptidase n=1 Tax=Phocaeicola TaxID=909656 RepID=UPI00234F519D|nr:S24/S26 family peptidase [Phocaeicola oris]MCE2617184.1 S24/S26 family peptidase [Phocaeicola oris]
MLYEVNTEKYISMLRSLVEEERDVSLLISGSSMAPFLIHHRDTILFGKPDRPLRRGDMVFYQRSTGQFVMHRIYKVKIDGYYVVGDAQTEIEGPLNKNQIFAIVKKVQRKGKWIGPNNFMWKFFERIYIRLVPVRPLIVKLYGLFR